MKSIQLASPAKINLFLKVLKKRKDGFHSIDTVFERVSLADSIKIQDRPDGKVKIVSPQKDVPKGKKNLCMQVALKLQNDFQVKRGVTITINKRIPVAAGLGGGSSNAATVLLGLNRLWRLGLSKKSLLEYGNAIGSDVAFFLSRSSWARGRARGEKIEPLKLKKKLWHILVIPRVKVYASQVYGALNYKLTKNTHNANILISYIENNNLKGIVAYVHNDLEHAVLKFAPGLSRLKKRLNSLGAQGVTISGSGPAVFGIVESKAQAERLKRVLEKTYARVHAVETV